MQRLLPVRVLVLCLLGIAANCIAAAQEPGDLAGVNISEVERVLVFTTDSQLLVVTLRIRWQIVDRSRFFANWLGISEADLFVKRFTETRLSLWLSEYEHSILVGALPSQYPIAETNPTYETIIESFVDAINREDLTLESNGIQLHSIDVIVFST